MDRLTNPDPVLFGEALRDLRAAFGTPLRQIVEAMGISHPTLSRTETGNRIVPLDERRAFYEAYLRACLRDPELDAALDAAIFSDGKLNEIDLRMSELAARRRDIHTARATIQQSLVETYQSSLDQTASWSQHMALAARSLLVATARYELLVGELAAIWRQPVDGRIEDATPRR